jgi:hypothetical protein
MSPQERLEEIKKQIAELEKEKFNIESSLMKDSDSLKEKFLIWRDSGRGEHSRWMITEEQYPVLRKYVDDHFDLQRYKTIDLLDRLEEDFYYAFEATEEDCSEWAKETYLNEKHLSEIKAVAKEMMEKNIVSFTCDW